MENHKKHIIPIKKMPKLNFEMFKSDMFSLPESLCCSIFDLLIMNAKAEVIISELWDVDDPFDAELYFVYRQFLASEIGLNCLIVAKKIRKIGNINSKVNNFGRQPSFLLLWELRRRRRCEYLKIARVF